VTIRATGVSGDSPFGLPDQQGTASGSGFVVSKDGYVVTNNHVVEGADNVTVQFGDDGETVKADVKGTDPSSDLAVLKVETDSSKLHPVPLGNSSGVNVGDPAVAIGNPFGVGRTVTTGIVSAVGRDIDAPNGFTITDAIQTDASINPGNSGGPLLDANGRVIGVNSQIATGGGRGSVGIGFAVPVNTLKRVLPQLRQGGEVERAFLGVSTTDLTSEARESLNLPVKDGALVAGVTDGSPADKAGLRGARTQTTDGLPIGGDIIVEIDGRKVDGSEDVLAAVEAKKPGDSIDVTYYRGDDKRTAKIELTERPKSAETGQAPQGGGGEGDGGGILPLP
jgi:S1-C subfamily serine protease